MSERPIMIVGEAWGAQEEEAGKPFVGPSGKLLWSMLSAHGISREECYVTNVFNFKPMPTNDVSNLCGPKPVGIPNYPALTKSLYVKKEYWPELVRLFDEVKRVNPNVIVTLGGTPLWALTRGAATLSRVRGTPILSTSGHKILPTYHPAAIFRKAQLRPIVYADLGKVRRESEYPEIRRPSRTIYIAETISDIRDYEAEHMTPGQLLAADIETQQGQITCIGFAPSASSAIVIPFVSFADNGSWWITKGLERQAWEIVRRWLREYRIVGQNFSYDAKYLWTTMGIPSPGWTDDTMLLHHSLFLELEKSLGFLGSCYTNEPSWKFMRSGTLKKED